MQSLTARGPFDSLILYFIRILVVGRYGDYFFIWMVDGVPLFLSFKSLDNNIVYT